MIFTFEEYGNHFGHYLRAKGKSPSRGGWLLHELSWWFEGSWLVRWSPFFRAGGRWNCLGPSEYFALLRERFVIPVSQEPERKKYTMVVPLKFDPPAPGSSLDWGQS